MMATEEKTKAKKTDAVGIILYAIYLLMLVASIGLIGRIIYIQAFFKPDPEIERVLTPSSREVKIEAKRGNILARDGRLLATSYPEYTVFLDCTVQKDSVWENNLTDLSNGLSRIIGGKSASQYRSLLANGRKKASRYLKLGEGLDMYALKELRELPILRSGKNRGGLIVETNNKRHYPYGTMGRRTIGFVREKDSGVQNSHIGLEGKFDTILSGEDGRFWTTRTDFGQVQRFDSAYVKANDGGDIRTTLDVNYQIIAHNALKSNIENEKDLEGGCVVLMDVKTGAIRAMVNLLRDSKTGQLEEISNLAIGRKGEPGSVFKSSCLMMMLENGHLHSLDETIPTNRGVLAGYGYAPDVHITDFERQTGRKQIPIIDGFKVSSNYMFRYLAVKHYGKRPQEYFDNLYSYKLGTPFEFDIEGLASPTLPNPKSKHWSKTDLTGAATGYAVDETPLQILCFYNAIAGGGRMMRPYLVEDIESDGVVTEERGPVVLDGKICSKATADTLTRALKAVTEEGTAKRLKGAKCTVAGKTGTARVALGSGGYTKDGKKKQQGTFVGFFPAEDPQYSIICTVYSYLSNKDFYGGTIPAATVRSIVDNICDIDPYWQPQIQKKAELVPMESRLVELSGTDAGKLKMPNLKGLSLSDAIHTIENMGLNCTYEGMGHVSEQIPEKGTVVEKGSSVNIILK